MKKVVIASGVRTPIGDFGVSLQPVKPLELMMTMMKESLRRAQLEKEGIRVFTITAPSKRLRNNLISTP